MSKTEVQMVPCPTCKKETSYSPANPHRPFCSERCRIIDLGSWASETYRIPLTNNNTEELELRGNPGKSGQDEGE
jgi:endogenous inhibitor of DNA gyrase (YacG/DUF329 family)